MKVTRNDYLDHFLRTALSIVGFPLSVTQFILSKKDRTKFKPTGQIVHIGSNKLHVNVSGQGSPTVILEAGMGAFSLDWCLVQPEISKFATVISYDRAGFGWSSATHKKSTCKDYVDDLRQALSALNLKPPYVLVGHSYGGLIMRLFAAEYPEEVAGLVLVDSTHENRFLHEFMDLKRKEQWNKAKKLYRLGYLLSPLGIPRFMKSSFVGSKRLPSAEQRMVKALGYQTKAYRAMYLELINSMESGRQLQSVKKLAAQLPVIVLTAGKQDEDWKKQQTELLSLTDSTKQIIVEDSWHSIQIHNPDIVIKSIREMVDGGGQLTSNTSR
ncbi:alpha/beta hydrolase [Paenibacillus sp. N3/727]|uniref:alpha/beta hydrolase n=1 Tax=Paenibacillus sp. N3/727 TaxID=2925845 RepID=UPI001F52C430|nr:alpha/beta hydrolase [Paenibacillus sp. N3/727]UNK16960.1 alpha/beta hydrolase [Paenibacillus sp. N3/727]